MPERGYGESLEKELFREEFPFGPVSRRGFLALGLLTLAACTPVVRRQGVPYVRQPEWVVEGGRTEFVTAVPHAGLAEPVLVRHYQERPLFLAPLEAAMSPYPLAGLYALYDPDRKGKAPDWEGFLAAWRKALGEGETLLVLPRLASPRLEGLLERAQARYPNLKVARFEAWSLENVYRGAEILFGQRAWPVYAPEEAEVVLLLDVDLHEHPAGYLWWAALSGRRIPPMNRIYAVESGAGLLGAMADHRLALKPSALEAFLLDLAKALGVLPGSPTSSYGGFLPALVEDLLRGGLLLPGVHLTPAAQALAKPPPGPPPRGGRAVPGRPRPPLARPGPGQAPLRGQEPGGGLGGTSRGGPPRPHPRGEAGPGRGAPPGGGEASGPRPQTRPGRPPPLLEAGGPPGAHPEARGQPPLAPAGSGQGEPFGPPFPLFPPRGGCLSCRGGRHGPGLPPGFHPVPRLPGRGGGGEGPGGRGGPEGRAQGGEAPLLLPPLAPGGARLGHERGPFPVRGVRPLHPGLPDREQHPSA
jgi:hypothetical protein